MSVSMKLQLCFKNVAMVFQGGVKGVSRNILECFKSGSRKFQLYFWEVSMIFQKSFDGI